VWEKTETALMAFYTETEKAVFLTKISQQDKSFLKQARNF
jgi:hypothetical protein